MPGTADRRAFGEHGVRWKRWETETVEEGCGNGDGRKATIINQLAYYHLVLSQCLTYLNLRTRAVEIVK